MKRHWIRFGLAALVGTALLLSTQGLAQAGPHGDRGRGGHHGPEFRGGHHGPGFHHGHYGHHRPGYHRHHALRHPPVVIVRPPYYHPPVYGYYAPPVYHHGCANPGAEIAIGVMKIIHGASRW